MPDSRWKLISIRTLCGEGDPLAPRSTLTRKLFLSTPSARRATAEAGKMVVGANHFYPRPPRGGRHASRRHRQHRANFYPRPPRGGRHKGDFDADTWHGFLSTPSARRATSTSISVAFAFLRFLSTPSARRATRAANRNGLQFGNFYPRPPRGGRPSRSFTTLSVWTNFYPRPPRGGRRGIIKMNRHLPNISIHALREEGDAAVNDLLQRHNISIHALREEGDFMRLAVHV